MSLAFVEYEIANQIMICELCFDICSSVKIVPGLGANFMPFYYNLNYSKGINILHSLLLSKEKNELSMQNYIKKFLNDYPKADITEFKNKKSIIAKKFNKIFKESLRNKITAHIDEMYKHSDFTCAYMLPHLIPKYKEVITDLKNLFFEFTNYYKPDYPFQKIKDQSEWINNNLPNFILKLK